MTIDPFSIACDTCGAEAGDACRVPSPSCECATCQAIDEFTRQRRAWCAGGRRGMASSGLLCELCLQRKGEMPGGLWGCPSCDVVLSEPCESSSPSQPTLSENS